MSWSSPEKQLQLDIFGKRFLQQASTNKGKRLEKNLDGLKPQRSKQNNLKKTENYHLKTENNTSRVTVKRGIFPNMICSKLIKRQLFNQRNDKSTVSSSSTSDGSVKLNQISRAKRLLTTEDSSTPPHRPNPTKKMKPDDDVLLDDSPFLLHLKRPGFIGKATDEPRLFEVSQPFAHETVEYTAMEKTRKDDLPLSFWPPSNAQNDRTKGNHLGSLQKFQKTESYSNEREYEEIKWKVAQVESCTSREAELKYCYQEFTESIKRVVIVERAKNFEEFPDALETIKESLRKLTLQRLTETSHDNAESSGNNPLRFTPTRNELDVCTPMNIDENIQSPLFFTPVPLNAEVRSRLTSNPSRVKSAVSDDEDAMPCAYNPKTRRAFEFERKNDNNDPGNAFLPPAEVRKVFQRPATQKNRAEDSYLFRGPSCSGVGDTIDHNAGLQGVEYLKNVTKNRVPKNDPRDRDWWDVSPPVNKYRGGNGRCKDDDDLQQWRNPSTPPPVLNSDLRRKTFQQNDDKNFLSSKRSSNSKRAANRDEKFQFGRVLSSRGNHRYSIEDYDFVDDELLMFGSRVRF